MSDDHVLPEADLGHKVAMPMVGFGTWQLRGSAAYEPVRYALEVGYRHLDTATMYRNEAEVGRAIRDSGMDALTFLSPPSCRPARPTGPRPRSTRACGTSARTTWTCG